MDGDSFHISGGINLFLFLNNLHNFVHANCPPAAGVMLMLYFLKITVQQTCAKITFRIFLEFKLKTLLDSRTWQLRRSMGCAASNAVSNVQILPGQQISNAVSDDQTQPGQHDQTQPGQHDQTQPGQHDQTQPQLIKEWVFSPPYPSNNKAGLKSCQSII